MAFTDAQVRQLKAKLDPRHIKTRSANGATLSYLEGWHAIAEANLESITAVVIGGVSLFGGRGSLVGALLGALTVGVLRSGLSFARVDDQYRVMAVGLLVILAVAVDQWIRKVRA